MRNDCNAAITPTTIPSVDISTNISEHNYIYFKIKQTVALTQHVSMYIVLHIAKYLQEIEDKKVNF